ncbi:uncharacterized protein LOC143039972 [Oratosquilla oratoria]|uniref:uncharacterized protein LOC143039972 n=1 Tax=Oratosquilla oratoria TaxID=337810 RepID=UPI003F76569B
MLKYVSPSRAPSSSFPGPEVTQQPLQEEDVRPAHAQPPQQEEPRPQQPPPPVTPSTTPRAWSFECDLEEEECRSEKSSFEGVGRRGPEAGAPGEVTCAGGTLSSSEAQPRVRENSSQVVSNHNTSSSTTSVPREEEEEGGGSKVNSGCPDISSPKVGIRPSSPLGSSDRVELARSHSLSAPGDTNIIYFKGDAKAFKSLVRSAAGPGGSVRRVRVPTIGERLSHKVQPRTPFDTLSINSFVSLTSMTSGRSSSRSFTSHSSSNSASSGSSANSANSSSSSNSNSSTSEPTSATLRVLVRCLGRHLEYKTLTISRNATCRQVVELLLAKCRVRHRDPNLFYLTMEVMVKRWSGVVARSVLVLDDSSRPIELQSCHPIGASTFALQTHPGGLVRVCDSILSPGSQYKSVLVSCRTTAAELVSLLLSYHSSKEPRIHYALHEVSHMPYQDRPLDPSELPLAVQNGWPKDSKAKFSFILRRNMTQALSLRRLSLRNNINTTKNEDISTSPKEQHCPEAKGSSEKEKIISQSSYLPPVSLLASKPHPSTVSNSLPSKSTSDSASVTQVSNLVTQASNFPKQTSSFSTQTTTFSTQTSSFPTQTTNFSTQTSKFSMQTSNFPTKSSDFSTQTSDFATQTSNLPIQTSNIPTKTCVEKSVLPSSCNPGHILRHARPCMTTGVFNIITSDTAVVQPTSYYINESKTSLNVDDKVRSGSYTAVSKIDTTPKETFVDAVVDAVIDCTHATPRISPFTSTTSQHQNTASNCLPSVTNKSGQTTKMHTGDSPSVPGLAQPKVLVPPTSHQPPHSCNIKDPPGRCCEMEIKVKHKCAHRCHKCFYI